MEGKCRTACRECAESESKGDGQLNGRRRGEEGNAPLPLPSPHHSTRYVTSSQHPMSLERSFSGTIKSHKERILVIKEK